MKVKCTIGEIEREHPSKVSIQVYYRNASGEINDYTYLFLEQSEFFDLEEYELIKQAIDRIKKVMKREYEWNKKQRMLNNKIKEFENLSFEFEVEDL